MPGGPREPQEDPQRPGDHPVLRGSNAGQKGLVRREAQRSPPGAQSTTQKAAGRRAPTYCIVDRICSKNVEQGLLPRKRNLHWTQFSFFHIFLKNKQPPSSMHSPTRFCLIFLLSFTVTFLESSTLLVPTCLNFLDQEFVLKGEERWHWREKSTVGCQIFILPNMDKVPSNSSLPHFSNKAHCQHLKGQAPPTFIQFCWPPISYKPMLGKCKTDGLWHKFHRCAAKWDKWGWWREVFI